VSGGKKRARAKTVDVEAVEAKPAKVGKKRSSKRKPKTDDEG